MKVKPSNVSNPRSGKGKGKPTPFQTTDTTKNPSLLRTLLQGGSSSTLLASDTAEELLSLLPPDETGRKRPINVSSQVGSPSKGCDSSSFRSDNGSSDGSASEETPCDSKKTASFPKKGEKSDTFSTSVVYMNDCLPHVPIYEPISPVCTPNESKFFFSS